MGIIRTPSGHARRPIASAFQNPTSIYSYPNREVDIPSLKKAAAVVRGHILQMTTAAGSGHPGGSLSAVDLLTALFLSELKQDPNNPRWENRDRFILSKGHASPVLYSILAECGYFSVDELMAFRKLGGRLQGHTDMRIPGVEMSSGSLGQGLSFGIGTCLSAILDGNDYHTYVMLGDGECDEGQIWEGALAAAHFALDNLTVIVDHNKIQNDGWCKDIMNIEPLADKWAAFGWNTLEINGHDFTQILDALRLVRTTTGQPSAIIAHTIKGKGVSFMENNPDFHGKAATLEQLETALQEIGQN